MVVEGKQSKFMDNLNCFWPLPTIMLKNKVGKEVTALTRQMAFMRLANIGQVLHV